MIEMQTEIGEETLRQVAALMMNAARTAPKARGVDRLEIALLTGDDRLRLAGKLREMGEESGRSFFIRDAENIAQAGAVVLIGSRYEPLGLNCGWCGFATCEAKALQAPAAPCAFNTNDLGIAVGSAVSVAADHRTDCRVLYSAGAAALAMNLLPGCRAVLALPLSATAKNPFFDRKPL
ncbi:MAG: ferredoxin [Rikenella sp.]|nr:ferredoxin [Rikenella sp.]